ncbi:FMN-dependent NADH-azoreductase [Sphingorhabdus sp.]|uniref:FMN-dependent NADH-azoreductase n=1 Tax=Sphingorhabdus sp. TaxID=1902408 RepID=UPI0035936A83
MNRLLHICASPRKDRSRSAMVADHFLARLKERYPALVVERLDLFDVDLPSFDQDAVEGRYHLLAGDAVDPAQTAAWQDLKKWSDQFLSFDSCLIATPMWNFGIPYRLKQYIDILTQPGLTFRNDSNGNVEGLAQGRRVIIIAASAMPFGSLPEIDGLDFQLAYLKAWLGFIGVTDIGAVRVAGTFGPEDVVAAAMARAFADADRLADTI